MGFHLTGLFSLSATGLVLTGLISLSLCHWAGADWSDLPLCHWAGADWSDFPLCHWAGADWQWSGVHPTHGTVRHNDDGLKHQQCQRRRRGLKLQGKLACNRHVPLHITNHSLILLMTTNTFSQSKRAFRCSQQSKRCHSGPLTPSHVFIMRAVIKSMSHILDGFHLYKGLY